MAVINQDINYVMRALLLHDLVQLVESLILKVTEIFLVFLVGFDNSEALATAMKWANKDVVVLMHPHFSDLVLDEQTQNEGYKAGQGKESLCESHLIRCVPDKD